MKRIDFNQLSTFVAIVDAGSITKAAATLHRTQAAISIQLKKLEDGLGKALLKRGYNQFSLTREGEILLTYARKILALSQEAFDAISDDNVSGVVRFGVPDGYARAFINDSLRQFTQRFPKIRIQIKNSNSQQLFDSLHKGELDLILVTKDAQESGGKLLRREKIQWVCSKEYSVDIQGDIPLALYKRGCAIREKILSELNQGQKSWYVSFECQGVTGFDMAITNGLAISAVAESLIKQEWQVIPANQGLPDLGEVEIELHTSPGDISEAIRCFSAQLSTKISNLQVV